MYQYSNAQMKYLPEKSVESTVQKNLAKRVIILM